MWIKYFCSGNPHSRRHVIHLTALGIGRSEPIIPSLVPRPQTLAAPILVQEWLVGTRLLCNMPRLRVASPSDLIGRKMGPH